MANLGLGKSRCRLSLSIEEKKRRCRSNKKQGQETQKWIIRYAILVAEGVRGHLSSSSTLDHCSWSQTINQTLRFWPIQQSQTCFHPRQRTGLAVQGRCFHLLASKHLDGQIEHPSLTTLVPVPGQMALATAHH